MPADYIPPMTRFHADAAELLRQAIADNGGREVFAIGDMAGNEVRSLIVTCRGQESRVTALLDRPRAGQVVIHNHPSGELRPSDADLALAQRYGEDGIGVVIVDNAVSRDNWVVEPYRRQGATVDPSEVTRYFRETLPRLLPDAEIREEQLEMALAVTRSFNEGAPLLVEAGTGTGKSLAYLVPAALWARANDAQVAVSTYTKALQAQLVRSDLPLLEPLDIDVAVLQGRNNYVCKRRLHLASELDLDTDDRAELEGVLAWSEISRDGLRDDLPNPVDPSLWERFESDSDLSLKVKCPFYASCFFYQARRRAAAAHIVVVNHALVLLDLQLRSEHGRGILPSYSRLVVDEGHHLEQAATGVGSSRVTALGIRRALSPLLSRPRRRGALENLLREHPGRDDILRSIDAVHGALEEVDGTTEVVLSDLVDHLGDGPRRLHGDWLQTPAWKSSAGPAIARLAETLEGATKALDTLQETFSDDEIPAGKIQPHFDVSRGRKRLAGQGSIARALAEHTPVDLFTPEDDPYCRWLARAPGRGPATAALVEAPIDVAPVLKKILWEQLPGTVLTSATLTAGRRFDHLRRLVGLAEGPRGLEVQELVLDSPFDHATQAILALPKDLPEPGVSGFWEATSDVVVRSVRASKGGAFVLCTSYDAVRRYAGALRAAGFTVLAQGERSRIQLLERFKEQHSSVLVGTDSFWEGVSVKGQSLRLVIVPRLPFRVPTDPLHEARSERLARRGLDPFRMLSLPDAILRLRQGYGRLIRSRSDRGVVMLLDRRLHARRYGRIILHSLPPAHRVIGPTDRVLRTLTKAFDRLGISDVG